MRLLRTLSYRRFNSHCGVTALGDNSHIPRFLSGDCLHALHVSLTRLFVEVFFCDGGRELTLALEHFVFFCLDGRTDKLFARMDGQTIALYRVLLKLVFLRNYYGYYYISFSSRRVYLEAYGFSTGS